MKINLIPYVILQVTSQFSCKFCITLQFHDTWFLWSFLTETLHGSDKKNPSKYNFSDFGVLPIPHATFKSTRSGFIQILRHCSLLQKITPLSGWVKIHQITHVIFETTSQFFLNFASLFSVMRGNYSVLFQQKLYMIWTKGVPQSAKFQTFDCTHEISPNL